MHAKKRVPFKTTYHDYAGCVEGNYFTSNSMFYDSWQDFTENWLGFESTGYDDTYHCLLRFDLTVNQLGSLELFFLLPRKGIYMKVYVPAITKEEWQEEIVPWLRGRKQYMAELWEGV